MSNLNRNTGTAQAAYPRIVIKRDAVSIKTFCAFCQADMREGPGPDFYLEGAYAVVCYACAKKRAPELAELIDVWGDRLRTCALCSTRDIGGGIQWDDGRHLCAPCWRKAADPWTRASVAVSAKRKRPILDDDGNEVPFDTRAWHSSWRGEASSKRYVGMEVLSSATAVRAADSPHDPR